MPSNVLAPNSAPDPIALVMAAFHAHLNHAVGCLEFECRLFACDGEVSPGKYACPCGKRYSTVKSWRKHLRDTHGAPRKHRGRWWTRTQRAGEIKPRWAKR
jgi:hypothetical protein